MDYQQGIIIKRANINETKIQSISIIWESLPSFYVSYMMLPFFSYQNYLNTNFVLIFVKFHCDI